MRHIVSKPMRYYGPFIEKIYYYLPKALVTKSIGKIRLL